jgi:hypothetical protein
MLAIYSGTPPNSFHVKAVDLWNATTQAVQEIVTADGISDESSKALAAFGKAWKPLAVWVWGEGEVYEQSLCDTCPRRWNGVECSILHRCP